MKILESVPVSRGRGDPFSFRAIYLRGLCRARAATSQDDFRMIRNGPPLPRACAIGAAGGTSVATQCSMLKTSKLSPNPSVLVMAGRISWVVLALVISTGCRQAKAEKSSGYNGFDLVDKSGNIRKPAGYRDHYESLGAYSVRNLNGDEELHYTWASPGTAEAYRKTGKFPDGAVLVKQTFATDHAPMTTGDAYWATQTIVWFVMIKDDKGRFPGNPLWSDGWGWALFKPDAPDKQVATSFKKDCQGCHIPAQATDWVYVQGYPSLRSK